jgi:hypothetical protein
MADMDLYSVGLAVAVVLGTAMGVRLGFYRDSLTRPERAIAAAADAYVRCVGVPVSNALIRSADRTAFALDRYAEAVWRVMRRWSRWF